MCKFLGWCWGPRKDTPLINVVADTAAGAPGSGTISMQTPDLAPEAQDMHLPSFAEPISVSRRNSTSVNSLSSGFGELDPEELPPETSKPEDDSYNPPLQQKAGFLCCSKSG